MGGELCASTLLQLCTSSTHSSWTAMHYSPLPAIWVMVSDSSSALTPSLFPLIHQQLSAGSSCAVFYMILQMHASVARAIKHSKKVSISYFWCQAEHDTSQILWAGLVLPEAEGTPQRLGPQTRCYTSLPRCSGQLCSTWCPLSADSSAVETADMVTQVATSILYPPALTSPAGHRPSKQLASFPGNPFNSSVLDPKTTVGQTVNSLTLKKKKDKEVNWTCCMSCHSITADGGGFRKFLSWFTNDERLMNSLTKTAN